VRFEQFPERCRGTEELALMPCRSKLMFLPCGGEAEDRHSRMWTPL